MQKNGNAINDFVANEAIDFILMRKENGNIAILNGTGEAEVIVENNRVGYRSITANPFGLEDTTSLLDKQAAFEHCYESNYPDALFQCKQLFESERTVKERVSDGFISYLAQFGFTVFSSFKQMCKLVP